MIDCVLIAAETSASFSEVWPYIVTAVGGTGGPLCVVLRHLITTYKEEKADLIGRLDNKDTVHRKEMTDVVFPLVEKVANAIEKDIESNGELGSDLRDLKTAMEIYFGPKKPGA